MLAVWPEFPRYTLERKKKLKFEIFKAFKFKVKFRIFKFEIFILRIFQFKIFKFRIFEFTIFTSRISKFKIPKLIIFNCLNIIYLNLENSNV